MADEIVAVSSPIPNAINSKTGSIPSRPGVCYWSRRFKIEIHDMS